MVYFFSIGRKQRVFPDALSDYILQKACFLSSGRPSSFHKSLLKEFLPLFPVKMVINLARVENIAGQKSLLDEHIDSLKIQTREGDNFVRMDILEQMEGISYFRPDDATEIFNIILDNPKEDSDGALYGVDIYTDPSRRGEENCQRSTENCQYTLWIYEDAGNSPKTSPDQ